VLAACVRYAKHAGAEQAEQDRGDREGMGFHFRFLMQWIVRSEQTAFQRRR
jgi:hypothetical protein